MPLIRKKTSNRVKTRDREKVKKKVRDSRKKKTKAANKNPQWKSKKPKDPGIPNDFPYKDQILAEVQEQRRIAAEEKRRLKEEKQTAHARAKAISRGEPVEEGEVEGSQKGEEKMEVDAEGIANLSAKAINVKLKVASPVVAETEEEEEEAPALLNPDLPNLLSVLEKADVILEVLDARDPLAFRSKYIEDIAAEKGKKILFVMNKIDRSPREAVAAWSERLRTVQPTLLFRSASAFLPEEQEEPSTKKGKEKVPVDDALGAESVISCLCEWAKTKSDEKITVAVVGLANVGKSSLINSLVKKFCLPIYKVATSSQGPTTTELPQEVSLNTNGVTITLIDSPGLSFAPEDDVDESLQAQNRARDILLRSKGRIDRLKNPLLPIPHIVSRASNEDLMVLYNLPAFAKGDFTAFLSGVARAHHLVKRRGDLDLTGAARIVLRDWNSSKFARYTTPLTAPPSKSSWNVDFPSFLTPLYVKDEAILSVLATRKEIRRKGGLVKLSSSEVEERKATLEEAWIPTEDDECSSEDEERKTTLEEARTPTEDYEDESSDDVEGENGDSANIVLDDDEEEEESKGEREEQEQGVENEGVESGSDSEFEDEKTTPAAQSRKQKRKRGSESLAPRPAKRVSLNPIISSTKSKKDRLLSRHSKLSKAQVKNELPSAAIPSKIEAAPKSILKKVGTTKASLSRDKHLQPQTGKSKKDGEGDELEYDFGKFF